LGVERDDRIWAVCGIAAFTPRAWIAVVCSLPPNQRLKQRNTASSSYEIATATDLTGTLKAPPPMLGVSNKQQALQDTPFINCQRR